MDSRQNTIKGIVRPPKYGERYFPLVQVEKINGRDPEFIRDRVPFEHLTPLFPSENLILLDIQKKVHQLGLWIYFHLLVKDREV